MNIYVYIDAYIVHKLTGIRSTYDGALNVWTVLIVFIEIKHY